MKFSPYILLIVTFLVISCKSPEPRRPITSHSETFFNESIERNKLIFEKEKERILALIDNDSTKKYYTSNNGFWYYYKVMKPENQKTPVFGDEVIFSYNISDLNGKALYSKKDLGEKQSYLIDKEELFTGLREGLKLMKEGEEITFIFPSQKAFGFTGDNNRIGINVPIVCEVTLYNIQEQ